MKNTLCNAFWAAALGLAMGLPASAQQEVSLAFGQTGEEATQVTLRLLSAPSASGLGWGAGLLVTNRGGAWIGGGVSYTHRFANDALFLRGTFMPGLYRAGGDLALGGPVVFATGLEVGTRLGNGANLSLLAEHRSNAGLYGENPGLDTLSIAYSLPFN